MKKFNVFKKAAIALTSVVAAAGIFFSAGTVHAIPYTGDTTTASPVPAFNVFTGVPQGVGNESDFFRSRVPTSSNDTSTLYNDATNATCENGQNIQMRIYVHNGASVDNNGNGSGASVAHGTSVKVSLPSSESATFTPTATISSSNAGTVNDTTTISCNGKMVKLTYVAGSAKANSIGTGTVAVSDSIVTSGAAISSHGVAGDVWGCWDERVYVILTVKVEVTPVKVPATCDLIAATTAGKTVTISKVDTTKNDATITGLTLDFGNGTTKDINVSELPYSYTYTDTAAHTVRATVHTSMGDVTSDKCATQVTPTSTPAVCEAIAITTTGRKVTITKVGYTGNNATVNAIVLNFGNGVTKTINPSELPYSYTYPKDGTYSITAVLKTSEGDTAVNNCHAQVKFGPSTITKLPDTGAAGTIAAFVGASFIGAFLYRMRALRSLQ